MQNNRWLQALIVLLVIIASAWLAANIWSFLIQFSNIFLLFFLSWLLAFILRPVARWLNRGGVPMMLSVLLVYLGLGLVFAVGGYFLIPLVTQQLQQLILYFPSYVDTIGAMVDQAQKALQATGDSQINLQAFYNQLAGQVQGVALSVLQNTFTLLQSVATLAVQLILIFLLSFYFMKDGERLSSNILHLMPPRWQDEIRLAAISIEKSFGSFIRGQLVFALVYGIGTAIVMMMPPFKLDYVVIASIVAGLCMIIPLIGNFLAYIPPMLICVVDPGKSSLWFWLLFALFVMQSLMMNFLGPRIMSSAIGLHPLYVVAAMLIGGQVAGFWGALFGIPVAGSINLIGRPLMRRIRYQTALYQDSGSSHRSLPTSAFLTGPLAATLLEAESRSAGAASQQTGTATLVEEAPALHTHPAPEPLPEEDEDLVIHPTPTLSARALRMVIVVASRVLTWAWGRLRSTRRK